MKIDKDTICCVSIAERPGNFGATIFNAIFQALNLNYIYKPFRVSAHDLEEAIKGVRAFGIRGCGVSMPHKTTVARYLDKIDRVAQRIGAVNTVVNDNGVLTGYNTDYEGVKMAVQERYDIHGKKALIIGAGGMARAIIVALQDCGVNEIWLANRDEEKGKKLAKDFSINYCPFAKKEEVNAQLLANATPIGMPPNVNEIIIDKRFLVRYDICIDVVVSPRQTGLIQAMDNLKKAIIPGFKMASYQGIAQFKLYTGMNAHKVVIENAISSYFYK